MKHLVHPSMYETMPLLILNVKHYLTIIIKQHLLSYINDKDIWNLSVATEASQLYNFNKINYV